MKNRNVKKKLMLQKIEVTKLSMESFLKIKGGSEIIQAPEYSEEKQCNHTNRCY